MPTAGVPTAVGGPIAGVTFKLKYTAPFCGLLVDGLTRRIGPRSSPELYLPGASGQQYKTSASADEGRRLNQDCRHSCSHRDGAADAQCDKSDFNLSTWRGYWCAKALILFGNEAKELHDASSWDLAVKVTLAP
jgi:hypothetical protein